MFDSSLVLPTALIKHISIAISFVGVFFLSITSNSSGPPVLEADELNRKVTELKQQGKYSEAIPIAKKIVEFNEKLAPEHRNTADSLDTLASLYRLIGDYGKAEPLYTQALTIRQTTLGPESLETAKSLSNLAVLWADKGGYSKAESFCRQALRINEARLGAEHPSTAANLNNLAEILKWLGNYSEAETLFHRALEIREKIGAERRETAETLEQFAQLYLSTGDYSKAEPLLQRALIISEKVFGRDHPATASVLIDLAAVYQGMASYTKAEPLLERALTINEQSLGPKHRHTATNLINLAALYVSMGTYLKAEPLYQRALTINQEILGPDHPDTAATLAHLATLYRELAEYAKAESLFLRAISAYEKSLGPEHAKTAEAISHLAMLYVGKGDYAKAEPLFDRALSIREKVFGKDHHNTATSLADLARLHREMGHYAKAESLSQHALVITEKAFGPKHPETVRNLIGMAMVYKLEGNYVKAEPLLEQALDIRERTLGPESAATAASLVDMAELYETTGDYSKAEPLYQRALRIREKTLGPEHPVTGGSLRALAGLYRNIGDYPKARSLLERALEIHQTKLGPAHPETAKTLNNISVLYASTGDYASAEVMLQKAITIRETALGSQHPDTATALNNLAALYFKMGEYAKAQPLYARALKIDETTLGPEHPTTALIDHNLGSTYLALGMNDKASIFFERGLVTYEKVLGPDHPTIGGLFRDLALAYLQSGNYAKARLLADKARQAEESALSNVLSFTSEQQRLLFQQTIRPYDLPATLGDARQTAASVLRQKGLILDSLLEDHLVAEASADQQEHETIDHLRESKQRLMQLHLEMPKDLSQQALRERNDEEIELSNKVETLESDLAKHVAGLGHVRRALRVTIAEVQATLAKDEVLIEFLRYAHYTGNGKFEFRYGAAVISFTGEPKWVPLGSAAEIETTIKLYQKSARGTTDEETLHRVLRALHAQVWAPVEDVLPKEAKRIFLSPDGRINFVSFATLLGADDKFVAKKYALSYVASGRDLLRATKLASSQTMLVYANPDFGGKPVAESTAQSGEVAMRAMEMRDLERLTLPALPGTAAEAAALEKRDGESVKAFLGAAATETELRQVNSPRILHLATHGFFLPEIQIGTETNPLIRGDDVPMGKLVNPMHRSGLAMAGAQRTLQAWARGEVPPTESDGIVTAEEVGGLKLNGTWLVVLSACDTGLGEARAGEGVLGLRRGFIEAGAQNLLMTLWPISDQTTVQIMLDFYTAADETGNAPQALAEVQRDWLVKLRKERGLLPAVQLAGPFIMSSQGKPDGD